MYFRQVSFSLVLALILCAAAPTLYGQTKPEDEEIRVDTDLIEVPFVVTDRIGKPILNLKKDNFQVYEDGQLQKLTDFAASSAPFEVALVLDTSGSTLAELPLIQRAAQNFISSLRPGDRVSVIAYRAQRDAGKANALSEVIVPLTSDRNALADALGRVQTSFGTPYYDSLVQVAERVFRDPPGEQFRGRRAIVALTDGVDSTSITDFDEAKELLEKTGATAYFIKIDTQEYFEENLLGDCSITKRFSQSQLRRYYRRFAGVKIEKTSNFCELGDFERLAISKKLYELADGEMDQLAKASGGRVFPIADLSEARLAFKKVADEIGMKYSLGYYSANEKRDGTYRKIKVEVKGLPPGTQIRAREGYTAPSK
jgi:Ca-activated chloride channel family protein